jgi:hypothetical protein
MSMYNMIFGINPNSDQLLDLLGATREDFGRFRDVYISGEYIVVHTRCGGGNRDDYFPEWVEDHPWYIRDEDCDFDSTYADIYFKIPEDDNTRSIIEALEQGNNPKDQWELLFKALKQ